MDWYFLKGQLYLIGGGDTQITKGKEVASKIVKKLFKILTVKGRQENMQSKGRAPSS